MWDHLPIDAMTVEAMIIGRFQGYFGSGASWKRTLDYIRRLPETTN